MARPEQTERATPKRRQEARQRGQVPKSQELSSAIIFLSIVLVLHGLFNYLYGGLQGGSAAYFSRIAQHGDFTNTSIWRLFWQAGAPIAVVVGIVFVVAMSAAMFSGVVQHGFLFTFKPLVPNFGKLNPISGFKSIFSKRLLINLGKQILKLAAVSIIIYSVIFTRLDFFIIVGQATPADIVLMTMNLIYEVAWKFGLLLLVVGILDYVYERWQNEENLKMSKQEVKDEYRQSEGNPEAKAALKRRQREFARRRMMNAVPRATVVVTNPTHFAVALEWDEVEMEAPVVTAKGADLLAKRIRDIAREHGVPIMENPPLARTLYERVELDQAIPPNLYAAVAQVIAFVYKLKRKTIA
jgi:flagellar biosynthetic protein FlhB